MSFLTDTENAIVARLKEKLPNVNVEAFPEKYDQYTFLQSKSSVLVHYLGATASESKSDNLINQELTVHWGVTILSRGLRTADAVTGSAGAYAILDDARSALVGYRINGCSKMEMESEMFTDKVPSGVWGYQLTVKHNTNYIEEQ